MIRHHQLYFQSIRPLGSSAHRPGHQFSPPAGVTCSPRCPWLPPVPGHWVLGRCWPVSLAGGSRLAPSHLGHIWPVPAPSLRVKGKGKCPALPHSSPDLVSPLSQAGDGIKGLLPQIMIPYLRFAFGGNLKLSLTVLLPLPKLKNICVSIVISLPAD